jgi:hypothetical protein
MPSEEDSDDWLNIDSDNLNAMLEKTLNAQKPPKSESVMDVDNPAPTEDAENALASEQTIRLKELANKVENFVEGEGGLEGALFEG